jgi:carboxymethylenebutenolidase
MIEQTVEIPTRDGFSTTFVCHPERGGPHPLVLFYMDAPAIREELRDMARRIASVGYYVMLPNLYYRRGVMELADLPALEPEAARERMFDLMNSLSIDLVMDDTDALLAYASGQAAASKGPAGCVGYCMSGRWVFGAAAAFPEQFKAIASIYGTGLHTDAPDSPHLTANAIAGEIYFGCAENDTYVPLAQIEALQGFLRKTGVCHRIEVYPATQHGFVFADRDHYQRAGAERHWERLFDLFARNLRGPAA